MSLNSIISKITGITDNGLNTASEVRSLLSEMSLEYFPYTGATKNVTSNYLYFSNVSISTISGASGTVLVTKDYLTDKIGGVSLPSGFEAIDEGSGIGWRLIGRNPTQFVNVGLEAIDAISYFGDATGLIGASGTAAAGFGEDNVASGYGAITSGYLNVASGSLSVGLGGNIIASGYGAIGLGVENTSAGNYTSTIGRGNFATAWYSHSHGTALNMNVVGGVAMGRGNTTTPTDGSLNPSATSPIFVIGNGTLVAGANITPTVASDALIITMAGTITAPSLTTALIDAEATGKVVLTREYLGSYSGGISGSTLALIGTTAPISSADTGTVGEIRVTSTYTYTCIATNTWVRSVAATW